MAEPEYEETLLAAVAIEPDRQLTLHRWRKRHQEDDRSGAPTTIERGWNVGLFDSEGNAVATLGRIEGSTSLAAIYESSAWSMFLAMIPRVTTSYFDLGSGPERTKA